MWSQKKFKLTLVWLLVLTTLSSVCNKKIIITDLGLNHDRSSFSQVNFN